MTTRRISKSKTLPSHNLNIAITLEDGTTRNLGKLSLFENNPLHMLIAQLDAEKLKRLNGKLTFNVTAYGEETAQELSMDLLGL